MTQITLPRETAFKILEILDSAEQMIVGAPDVWEVDTTAENLDGVSIVLRDALKAAQAAAPYDQQALELCDKCGWKTVVPGEPCLMCEKQLQAAVEPVDDDQIHQSYLNDDDVTHNSDPSTAYAAGWKAGYKHGAWSAQAAVEPVAYIRRDQLQKARMQAMLCEVTPEARQDRVAIYTSPPDDLKFRPDWSGVEVLAEELREAQKAMQLALEALNSCTPGDWSTGHVIHPYHDENLVDAAIAALEKEIK